MQHIQVETAHFEFIRDVYLDNSLSKKTIKLH